MLGLGFSVWSASIFANVVQAIATYAFFMPSGSTGLTTADSLTFKVRE